MPLFFPYRVNTVTVPNNGDMGVYCTLSVLTVKFLPHILQTLKIDFKCSDLIFFVTMIHDPSIKQHLKVE